MEHFKLRLGRDFLEEEERGLRGKVGILMFVRGFFGMGKNRLAVDDNASVCSRAIVGS
jgi:hypothetical protein